MKDIENTVLNTVKTALVAEYPDLYFTADYVPQSSKFPTVSCVELSNVTYMPGTAMDMQEQLATVEYQFEVFTYGAAKKRDGKKIRDIIDSAMATLQFTRTFSSAIPNSADLRIWRYVSRYTKII